MENFDSNVQNQAVASSLNGPFPSTTSEAIDSFVKTYLDNNYIDAFSNPEEITDDIMSLIANEFQLHNETVPAVLKKRPPSNLTPNMIAKIMLHMYCIRNINCAGVNSEDEYDLLGFYQEDGPDKGIYVSREDELKRMILAFNPGLTPAKLKETLEILRIEAPRAERCSDRDLIAINNGIFNYKTKIVEPFDSEIVFTAKCRVNYNPAAQNITIHNDEDNTDWDVENWIKELFDDAETAECIWQIIGAIIRPNVGWRKSAWFISEKGNNGKGTLCHLMRNLAGDQSYAAIQLSDFGKEFMLEPLIGVTAIITDENDVGTFIEKAANLKAVITNDVIQINRKKKKPIAYQFTGLMIQCVNAMPRTKDRSESFYRRCLLIPFTKCYTGIERKYIKDDYLNREEVLEYVLYRVLNMNYYEITEPECAKIALNKYKTYNDPVREFLTELTEDAAWSCFQMELLYDMYKGWEAKTNPNGGVLSNSTFKSDVIPCIESIGGEWYFVDSDSPKRVLWRMDGDEPLLDRYNCEDWMEDTRKHFGRTKLKSGLKPVSTWGIFRDCTPTGITPVCANNTDGNDGNE